jgi:hypothetical protein
MTVYIAHGFNVRDPRVFFRVGQAFAAANHEVVEIDYGWTGLISARVAVAKHGKKLAEVAKPGDIAIGHSNGCALIQRALYEGAPLRQVMYINPALHRRLHAPFVERCDVYYSTDDLAVLFGRYLRWFSPLRLIGKQTTWGAMGRTGYVGNHPVMHNHDLRAVLEVPDDERVGHSGAFVWHNVSLLNQHMLARTLH